MTDTNMTRKDNNHGMPTHYGYRNKDFNDMVNSFFNNWLDFPYENTAMKAAARTKMKSKLRLNCRE